jgi:hypothetical protein
MRYHACTYSFMFLSHFGPASLHYFETIFLLSGVQRRLLINQITITLLGSTAVWGV